MRRLGLFVTLGILGCGGGGGPSDGSSPPAQCADAPAAGPGTITARFGMGMQTLQASVVTCQNGGAMSPDRYTCGTAAEATFAMTFVMRATLPPRANQTLVLGTDFDLVGVTVRRTEDNAAFGGTLSLRYNGPGAGAMPSYNFSATGSACSAAGNSITLGATSVDLLH